MLIKSININNLRSIASAHLKPSAGFNLICGENGSGKSTFLEAIYLLGFGRSFRANQLNNLIKADEKGLVTFVELLDKQDHKHAVGLEKLRQKKINIRINGEAGQNLSQLSSMLPVQIISPESFQFLTAGPQVRRKFVDWSVFHVEPLFIQTWQRYQRALAQRNAFLRSSGYSRRELSIWNEKVCTYGEALSIYREEVVNKLLTSVDKILKNFLEIENITLSFSKGWDDDASLKTVLERSVSLDERLGYTKFGPHRADLQVFVNGVSAAQILSRGQQKLLITGLMLAQGQLLVDISGKNCVYLVDDLVSELDQHFRRKVIELMGAVGSQVFISGIEESLLLNSTAGYESQMFHVKHGVITPHI